MKKSLLFSMMCMFLCLTSILHAQNPNPDWESVEIPEVIFTECYIGNTDAMYCEITNTEDTAVDLSSFDLIGGPHRYLEYFPDERWFVKIQWNGIIKLDGIILQPGESKVFAKVFDKAVNADNPTTPKTNLNMLPYIDHVIFEEDSDDPDVPFIDQPEILAFDFDSITSDELERGFLGTAGGRQAWGLLYHYEHLDSLGLMTQDSIMADIFNLWQQDGTDLEGTVSNIAGVESATVNSIIVRKYGSKSSTNWDISRGVASEDSYWMVVKDYYPYLLS